MDKRVTWMLIIAITYCCWPFIASIWISLSVQWFFINATIFWFFAWVLIMCAANFCLGCNHGILHPHTSECEEHWQKQGYRL